MSVIRTKKLYMIPFQIEHYVTIRKKRFCSKIKSYNVNDKRKAPIIAKMKNKYRLRKVVNIEY